MNKPGKAGIFISSGKCESESLLLQLKAMGASLAGVGDVSVGLARDFQHIPKAISPRIHHPLIHVTMHLFLPFY
ncbi:MAG TPA: hypothetical protein DCQ14_00240, partial [Firmicutes bacterium]|nr:hypothetical protein [Bacillota bacterium]